MCLKPLSQLVGSSMIFYWQYFFSHFHSVAVVEILLMMYDKDSYEVSIEKHIL